MTAVTETGHRLAQSPDGRARHTCAERFAGALRTSGVVATVWTLDELLSAYA
ncbi:hypothetical protein ACWDZ4_05905 [Streptomyces sp. NPDC003016]